MRIEKDSLGKVRIPDQAEYGPQTQRAIENFPISGQRPEPALVRAYLRLKLAAARANRDEGALSPESCSAIESAALELLAEEDRWGELFVVDPYQAGAGTSLHMNINEVIARRASREFPTHPNDHVNRSQSTNDTFPTAMRLSLLEASHGLEKELSQLAATFLDQGERWSRVPKAARTHLQDAVPMTLGQEFKAYGRCLERLGSWLTEARDGLRELGIGGSAAGTGLNVPARYRERIVRELSALTGEPLREAVDLCEAMQSQAPVGRYSSALRAMALELTRICNDLRLLASGPLTGLGEIELPAVQPGSSIMPGKVNPSLLEMANQTWFAVLGFDQTVAFALQAGQLELNVMMPIMAHALLEATRVSTHALSALRSRCIEGILPVVPRLRLYFERTPQIATALNPILGYEQVAKLVQDAAAEGVSVVELIRQQGLIPEHELRELLEPRRVLGNSV